MTEWDGSTERRQSTVSYQQKILDRLTEVEVEVRLIRPILLKLDKALCGNGGTGLLIEHDRVKRTVDLMCWALGVVSIAVIGMLVKRWMG